MPVEQHEVERRATTGPVAGFDEGRQGRRKAEEFNRGVFNLGDFFRLGDFYLGDFDLVDFDM